MRRQLQTVTETCALALDEIDSVVIAGGRQQRDGFSNSSSGEAKLQAAVSEHDEHRSI